MTTRSDNIVSIASDIDAIISGEGYEWICGVDEAGRGPLSGPVPYEE